MSKFGYGHYTGIDLSEERSGNMPTREWKLKRFKKPWYQGDTIPVGIGQGYWTATPIQMSKAMMILINDGVVKVPHLLMSTIEDGKQVPWSQPHDYWSSAAVAAGVSAGSSVLLSPSIMWSRIWRMIVPTAGPAPPFSRIIATATCGLS